jgi:DnaJ-class molecular chaperone
MLINLQTLKKDSLRSQSNQINNLRAYDTIGDAEKRKSYDNYGITGDEQAQYQDFMKNMGGGSNKILM